VVPSSPPRIPADAADVTQAGSLRWIAAAAGSIPEMSQVQIEQDIDLAADVFGPGGRVLFGAGHLAPVVQVLNSKPPDPDAQLRLTLGDLFSPRGGRHAHYRRPQLQVHDAATARSVLDTLRAAVAEPGEPLLVYLAGHGDMGEKPKDNRMLLWGQTEIRVTDLGAVLDQAKRPVQVVATTCFSGGFGELVFRQAEQARGPARTLRCGLFAAPWDLEASGCDPNPDRATQQGYGLHFLNALRGRDRDGAVVPLGDIDLDQDGAVSLLEAHTRVRLFSEAADVPTSTSERWLRHAAPEQGKLTPVTLPEDDHVIEVLSDRLGLRGPPSLAYADLDRRDQVIAQLQRSANQASQAEALAYREAAASLLAVWPVLDDPWHPEFAATLADHASAITTHLAESEAYRTYLSATAAAGEAHEAVWVQRTAAAPVERLVRALDNRELASRLAAEGGAAWGIYEALLDCERTVTTQ